jgi:hypothetical protein
MRFLEFIKKSKTHGMNSGLLPLFVKKALMVSYQGERGWVLKWVSTADYRADD